MTRHAGGMNPCPYIDLNKGFNEIMAKAYNLPEGETIESKFGAPFGVPSFYSLLLLSCLVAVCVLCPCGACTCAVQFIFTE